MVINDQQQTGVGVNGVNGVSDADINGANERYCTPQYTANGHCALNVADAPNGDNITVQASSEPIAIVGMAMRLPGGVNNGPDFWDMLVEKRDGRIRVPGDRYNVDAFYNASGKPGSVKMQHGNFLQGNLKHLDTSFFSMTRSETEKLDPQARLLLEVSREALENAGETRWRGEDIGCYVGVFGEDWQDIHLKDSLDSGMYRVTGYGDV
jgi:acyl transferase domain-containing protein